MPRSPPLPPFTALVDLHGGTLAAYLGGMLSKSDAEDALQETLLAALRAYPGFDGSHPRAWLLTIARNKAIDAARAAARRPEALTEPDRLAAAPDSAGGVPGEEVRDAVAGLPAKQREAIVLRFGADLRYREVASAMGCSEAAARRSVHEGLKRLRATKAIERTGR